jgi:flagellar protein FlaI
VADEEVPEEALPDDDVKAGIEKAGLEDVVDEYDYQAKEITINVRIGRTDDDYVPIYEVSLASISETTELVLERIRQELVKSVNLGLAEITDTKESGYVEEQFESSVKDLVNKYFPDMDEDTRAFLQSYLVAKSLGLGDIELVMSDENLEEIVVNQAEEPIWVYHREHGWLKTNIFLKDEEQIKHYASMIARRVGRQITVLEPLLDAHLEHGDRVNATITPISTAGNTMTIRKFARDPWTITKFLQIGTINVKATALIWMALQYEMSALVAGGTASGKTSTLNVMATFIPPNQRVISIEDTREVQLPSFLHWVPLNTRLANAEGKGEISMEDLLVNSLRMRPDRILVGEVRRQKEAETLFEAIHTGHSCYATFHANNAKETVERLTNPPINVPEIMLPAISLVIVQFRNRRTGKRRTFQVAEITEDSEPNIVMQYDAKKDELVQENESKVLFDNLKMYTGYTEKEIQAELDEKKMVLEYLMEHDITTVEGVGRVMAEYYTNKDELLEAVEAGESVV